MGTIHSGTVCPFPFTLSNASDNSLASCTKTFGEVLDPGLLIFQVMNIAYFGGFALPILLRRIWLLRQISIATKTSMFANTQSKLCINATIMCIAMVVQMIDPLGFRNIVTPYLYFIMDEVVGASMYLMVLFTGDFFVATANSTQFKRGLGKPLMTALVCMTYVNCIGFQVVGMYLTNLYGLFETFKLLGGLVLLVVFGVVSYRAQQELLRILVSSSHGKNVSLCAALRNKQDKKDIPAGVNIVLVAKKKFFEYLLIVAGGVMVHVFAILIPVSAALEDPNTDFSWGYRVEDEPHFMFFAFKAFCALAIIVLLRTFHVPRPAATDSQLQENQEPMTQRQMSSDGGGHSSVSV